MTGAALFLGVQVITDPVTGRSKGYGFVRFGNEAERDRALSDMMGHFIASRPIRVSLATAKKNPGGLQAANAAQARLSAESVCGDSAEGYQQICC